MKTLEILTKIQESLVDANYRGIIMDTIWVDDCTSLFDFIDIQIQDNTESIGE
jgi:hypothetical protein